MFALRIPVRCWTRRDRWRPSTPRSQMYNIRLVLLRWTLYCGNTTATHLIPQGCVFWPSTYTRYLVDLSVGSLTAKSRHFRDHGDVVSPYLLLTFDTTEEFRCWKRPETAKEWKDVRNGTRARTSTKIGHLIFCRQFYDSYPLKSLCEHFIDSELFECSIYVPFCTQNGTQIE